MLEVINDHSYEHISTDLQLDVDGIAQACARGFGQQRLTVEEVPGCQRNLLCSQKNQVRSRSIPPRYRDQQKKQYRSQRFLRH